MAMVSVLISELSGRALDYAVAKCECVPAADSHGMFSRLHAAGINHFSRVWNLAGPIIEREQIDLLHRDMQWTAIDTMEERQVEGPTPLVAAMRCYVASKTEGDSVMIPEELI